ncbi:MAG TPA: MYXO-CTERM sorting domain-containing protein, partial [Polyangia bacterium]|nr:MYXO-CTERM sorting domain-containing protein [Polyangia bacterium]
AGGGATGAAGATATGGTPGSGGSSTTGSTGGSTGNKTMPGSSSGCAVAGAPAEPVTVVAVLALALVSTVLRRRRTRA